MAGSNPEILRSVAIAVAPNGGRRTKADHPALPVTTEEISATAAACLDAGACMIHAHIRNPQGHHLLDPDAYRATIAAVRAAVGDQLVIQITSEALGIYKSAEQMAVVRDVRPEAVSIALRELAPDASHEPAFADFLTWLRREKVTPQIILYSPEEAARLAELKARGLIPFNDVPVLYVLGRYTVGQKSAPSDLLPFLVPDMPRFTHWSVCAFGAGEHICVTAAALLGGNVRVGFENNLWMPDGSIARDNADLVTAARATLSTCSLAAATAAELRAAWSAMV